MFRNFSVRTDKPQKEQTSLFIFFLQYTSPMRYEAIIDDNVKLSEFEEKYKIIEKRGDIYVIEEIESDDK